MQVKRLGWLGQMAAERSDQTFDAVESWVFHGGNTPERIGEQPSFYSIRLGKDRRRNFWDHLRNTMARLIWQSRVKWALSTNSNVDFMYSCTSSGCMCVFYLSINPSIYRSIDLSMLFYSILFYYTLLFILLYSSLFYSIPFYSILIVSYRVVSYRIVSNLSIHLSVCL